MRSLFKKRAPVIPDVHKSPPQTRWRVTPFLVFALTFGLTHATYADVFCVNNALGLQAALNDAAYNGEDDEIHLIQNVNPDDYMGNFTFTSIDSFYLRIRGGYTNCWSNRPEPVDPSTTILDGDGDGPVLLVLTSGSNVNVNFTLDGVTVRNGGTGMPGVNGGGVYILGDNGNATLSNNIIVQNFATGGGGGVFIEGLGTVTLDNNIISNNTAGINNVNGSGVYIADSTIVILTGNSINNNTGNSAVYFYSATDATFVGNNINGNTGSGIIFADPSTATFTDNDGTPNGTPNSIIANTGSGIIFADSSTVDFTNGNFIHFNAESGIIFGNSSTGTFTGNCSELGICGTIIISENGNNGVEFGNLSTGTFTSNCNKLAPENNCSLISINSHENGSGIIFGDDSTGTFTSNCNDFHPSRCGTIDINNNVASGVIFGDDNTAIFTSNCNAPWFCGDGVGDGVIDINNNTALSYGGGVFFGPGTNATIAGSLFDGNYAPNGGGAYFGADSDATLTGNTFINNNATEGGGIYFYSGTATLIDNILGDDALGTTLGTNFATNGGGAYFYSGTATLIGNDIDANVASNNGGGVYFSDDGAMGLGNTAATFINNVISDNFADGNGGGLYIARDTVTLTNNTISGNIAGTNGDEVWLRLVENFDTADIYNNIIWSGIINGVSDLYLDSADFSSVEIFNNYFAFRNFALPDNIVLLDNTVPVVPVNDDTSNFDRNLDNQDNEGCSFVNAPNDNYRLLRSSVCVDVGDNNAPFLPPTDKDGNPRKVRIVTDTGPAVVDMGAYEQQVPFLQFWTASDNVTEGVDFEYTFVVTREGSSNGAVSVDYNFNLISGDTAAEGVGDDYIVTTDGTCIPNIGIPSSGTCWWADGDSDPKTIIVEIIDDNNDPENEEFLTVTLDNVSIGATLGIPNVATLNIIDLARWAMIVVNPEVTNADRADRFDVDVEVHLDAGEYVHNISAHIDFDTAYLEVVGITAIVPVGYELIKNNYNNASGEINFVFVRDHTISPSFPNPRISGPIALQVLTIEMRVKDESPSGDTDLSFQFDMPRVTDAIYLEQSVLDDSVDGTVTVSNLPPPPPNLDVILMGHVDLEGRLDAAAWITDLTVDLINVIPAEPDYTNLPTTTDENGDFVVHPTGLDEIFPGTYDIYVKNYHTLQNRMLGKELVRGENHADFGTLLEGDAYHHVVPGDTNVVNLNDFNRLANTFGTTDWRADFNQDGGVTLLDFILLANNFGLAGPFTVPLNRSSKDVAKAQSVQSSGSAKVAVTPAKTKVNVGEGFELTIEIGSGEQGVIGASAELSFNPKVMQVEEIIPGGDLNLVLENRFDNRAGTINFAAAALSEVSGSIELVTIRMKAMAPSKGSIVKLNAVQVVSGDGELSTQTEDGKVIVRLPYTK